VFCGHLGFLFGGRFASNKKKRDEKMKLYEILLRKVGLWENKVPETTLEKSKEELIYNPIGCKVGGVVKIDSLDFRDHRFTVKEIQEYSISFGNGHPTHRMVDYVLVARPIGKPDFTCRLRVVPNPDSKSVTTHRTLLMTKYDDLAYDEGLHQIVQDDTKKFVIDDDSDPNNIVHDEFWRVNDVGTTYKSNVKILTEVEGSINESFVEVDFWDYSRMTDMDGVEVEEFVFVEMDKKDGWFNIWRGSEVNSDRIEVF
jgi:hypothetical protein